MSLPVDSSDPQTLLLLSRLYSQRWKLSPADTAVHLSRGKWNKARHLAILSDWLRAAVLGERKRIVVTMPPRHGKSEEVSKWFPTWVLETFHDWRVMLSSYEAMYAASWGRKVRDLLEGHADELTVRVKSNSKAADYWETTEGGGMMTAGAGGALTGKGANVLIVDDPIKNWAEANSPVVRERIWDWWQSTAYTRLEPDGIAIVVQTRWHEDDLAGRLLRGEAEGREKWDLLNLPAIAEAGDMMGREIGEPLWPERFGLQDLERIQG